MDDGLIQAAAPDFPAGSLGALIIAYRDSPEWRGFATATCMDCDKAQTEISLTSMRLATSACRSTAWPGADIEITRA